MQNTKQVDIGLIDELYNGANMPASEDTLQYTLLLPNKRRTPNEAIKYTLII